MTGKVIRSQFSGLSHFVGMVSVAVAMLLVMAAVTSFAADRQGEDVSALVKVGDVPPDFNVTTDDGTEVTLQELQGKVVLVTFFATYCPACKEELPHIEKLWAKHGDHEEFVLLVIGRQATDKAVAEYKQEHGYSFPVAADPEREIYEQFATKSIPREFVIDRNGKVIFQSTGFSKKRVATLGRVLDRKLR